MSNFNNLLNCANNNLAHNGANSDITSLTGLTGQFTVAEGGTGAATLTSNGVLLGNGTSAISATAAGTNGQLLLGQTGSAPTWNTMSGDATLAAAGALTLANSGVSAGSCTLCNLTLDAKGRTTVQASATQWAGSGGYRNLKITAAGGGKTASVSADEIGVATTTDNQVFPCTAVSQTLNMGNSGANGIDTGSVAASTLYFVFEIYNGTTCASLGSRSASAPTLPNGYTYTRRIGAFFTDGSSNIVGGTQLGNRYRYLSTTIMASGSHGTFSGTAPVWSAQSIASFVPTTAASYAVFIGNRFLQSGGDNVLAAPNNSYNGPASSTGNPPLYLQASTGGGNISADFVYESSSVYWVGSGNNSAIGIYGWDDNL